MSLKITPHQITFFLSAQAHSGRGRVARKQRVYGDRWLRRSAHSGNNSLNLAPGNPLFPSELTQTLSTVTGSSYLVSFFAAAGGVNTFSLSFGDVPIAGAPTSFPDTIPMGASDFTGDYTKYSFLVTATSSHSVLELGGTSTDDIGPGPDVILIDDISVIPSAAQVRTYVDGTFHNGSTWSRDASSPQTELNSINRGRGSATICAPPQGGSRRKSAVAKSNRLNDLTFLAALSVATAQKGIANKCQIIV